MSAIAGIDLSTRAIDVVLLDEDTDHADWHSFDLTECTLTGNVYGDAFERARRVRAAMPTTSWWDDNGVIAIGIEDPRGHSAGHIFRIQGAILACLPTRTLVQPWIPSGWRKAVGLPGNCPKDAVAAFVHERAVAPGITWGQDACDALCIALATRDALERTEAAA